MGQGPALEEFTDCQGEVALVLNTSQILISCLCALMILLKHKSDLTPAQNLDFKSDPFALKNSPALK